MRRFSDVACWYKSELVVLMDGCMLIGDKNLNEHIGKHDYENCTLPFLPLAITNKEHICMRTQHMHERTCIARVPGQPDEE